VTQQAPIPAICPNCEKRQLVDPFHDPRCEECGASMPCRRGLRRCFVCGATAGIRSVTVLVEGDELRLKPDLCVEHCNTVLLRWGQVLGEL
jgi:hypothetical protein